jgi:hypothetical protein
MKAAWLAPAVFSLLAACAVVPTVDTRQLAVLDKGMTPAQAMVALVQPPLAARTVAAGNNPRGIRFLEYRVRTGDVADVYFLAFERERLVYWGYPMEFRRQPDRALAEALDLSIATPAPPVPTATRP